MIRFLTVLVLFVLTAGSALASPPPSERMDDPVLEERARGLYRELRCVECQSQSIDESNAFIAGRMREVVRERLLLGESDPAIRDYMQARYGDYVLMMPPLQANTLGLWLMPVIILFGGAGLILVFLRQQRRTAEAGHGLEDSDAVRAGELSDEEGLQ